MEGGGDWPTHLAYREYIYNSPFGVYSIASVKYLMFNGKKKKQRRGKTIRHGKGISLMITSLDNYSEGIHYHHN